MKKSQKLTYILCTALFIVIALALAVFAAVRYTDKYVTPYADAKITDQDISITETGYHPANFYQHEASMVLTVSDHRLYFYPIQMGKLVLSTFRDGDAKVADLIEKDFVLYAVNGFIYYTIDTEDSEEKVYAYDIATGQITYLVTADSTAIRRYYVSQDGSLFVPTDETGSEYHQIRGNLLEDGVSPPNICSISGKNYALQYEANSLQSSNVVICSEDGTVESVIDQIPRGVNTLIPCDAGLLVHHEEEGGLLYLIEENSGDVIELFSVKCLFSESAVNVHGDYVYLSFKRYEKHGEFGMVRFQDDNLEGTYRISLTDYTVEKLSDDIYDGLYIFDDTGIYACNEDGCIYKLDFDGQRILTLLEQ